jgi:hypothetical protein
MADDKNGMVRIMASRLAEAENGAIGYIAAWILGVPASILFVIFLLRGCN